MDGRNFSLAYCRPKHLHENAENIGAYLEGDREENSLYDLEVNVHKFCAVLCAKVSIGKKSSPVCTPVVHLLPCTPLNACVELLSLLIGYIFYQDKKYAAAVRSRVRRNSPLQAVCDLRHSTQFHSVCATISLHPASSCCDSTLGGISVRSRGHRGYVLFCAVLVCAKVRGTGMIFLHGGNRDIGCAVVGSGRVFSYGTLVCSNYS